ncbi:MAG: phosphatase PAP2 family protein [Clostridia bacterium]|nr:phosphatase PAP2 family protein [Clostridia bacterium]
MEQLAIRTLPFLTMMENARIPAITTAFNLLTYLGDEKLFVVIALIVFWCFSKRGGLYMLTVGFGASAVGQTLKMLLHVRRPWELGFEGADATAKNGFSGDGLLGKIMSKLGEGADGWSFPSGHTLIGVGTYGSMAAWFRSKWVRTVGFILAFLIPVTRLYLGVHTPLDIIAGVAIALALVFLLRPVFRSDGEKKIRIVLIGSIALTCVLLGVTYLSRPAGLEGEGIANYASGIKNLWQLIGATAAVWLAFEVDERWTHFDTRAAWWAQLLKIAGGCVIVLGLQMGIQKVFGYDSKAMTLDNMTRMGIIACAANFAALAGGMAAWPMSFSWFASLGHKN